MTTTNAVSEVERVAWALVLENGKRWRECATEQQVVDLHSMLADEHRWHWIGRSRGYSKTSDVAAATLGAMLSQLPAGSKAYAAAADRDQARLLVDSIEGYAIRTPELKNLVKVEAFKVSTPSTGVTLDVLAADGASAYGLRPSWLVIDELCQWPESVNARRFYEAISTAVPKMPNARGIVITTAGSPGHWSRGVYDTAVAEPEIWRVSEIHEPAPWIDRKLVEAERRRLPESAFGRLWQNRWAAPEDSAFRYEDVIACATLDGALAAQPNHRYVVTVDLGWRNDRTAVAVAHADGGMRLVVDRLEVIQGTKEHEVDLTRIETMLETLAREYDAPIYGDPAQFVSMRQRLQSRGLRVFDHVFSATSNTKLALLLLELVRANNLRIPNREELVSEFLNVRIVEKGPGLYRVDHAPDKHDDQVVAVGMAAMQLINTHTSNTQSYFDALMREHGGAPRQYDDNGLLIMSRTEALALGYTAEEYERWTLEEQSSVG